MPPHLWIRNHRSTSRVRSNEQQYLYDLGSVFPCAKRRDNTNQSQASLSSAAANTTGNSKQIKQDSRITVKPSKSIPRTAEPRLLQAPVDWALQGAAVSIGAVRSASMLDTDRSRSRRERTFVGGQCAACDELLEHTLKNERVLQFSCGHVAHEACLYEYIKDSDSHFCPTCDAPLGLDSARAGSVLLDLNKLSTVVRSIQQAPVEMALARYSEKDGYAAREDVISTMDRLSRANAYAGSAPNNHVYLQRIEELGLGNKHQRNHSDDLQASVDARRYDYQPSATENPHPNSDTFRNIPAPKVAIRSEFPTLTRSSQQQSLTCLVTVEVPSSRARSRLSEHIRPLSSQQLPAADTYQDGEVPMPLRPKRAPKETQEILEAIADELKYRVDNWHGLDFEKFGPLRLHGTLQVGKDGNSWQTLECYLFEELLICLKEKQTTVVTEFGERPKCSLKGSILIRRHLKDIQASMDDLMLTLNLIVPALPSFHLKFTSRSQLDLWKFALHNHDVPGSVLLSTIDEQETLDVEDDEWVRTVGSEQRNSSVASSAGSPRTGATSATDYSDHAAAEKPSHPVVHIPLDIVVVVPVSSSMQGLKIKLLQDTLRFLVHSLGEHDRMGLVTFGANGGAVPLVGMTTKTWLGWDRTLNSIKPTGHNGPRADCVEGASVAMDLLLQRRGANPISSIFVISDSPTSETESVDFVVQRAETNKVGIYTFGLGQSHKPDSLVEMSARTKASYTYVKDWMMIRECAAGCLGSLQSVSHMSAKLKLRLPEGSPAKIVKISGALQTSKRVTGREAEALVGDLRFGDKRDILVQLAIDMDTSASTHAPHDHWESIVSGLEALSGALENNEPQHQSLEEVPLLQADLSFNDLGRDGLTSHLSQPSLLIVTVLPETPKSKHHKHKSNPMPIPPHPSIVQRRMELLTSDMLTRALTLVSKGQHDRAHHLLAETRTILQGLGKGSLPPLPPVPSTTDVSGNSPRPSTSKENTESPRVSFETTDSAKSISEPVASPSPKFRRAPSLNQKVLDALDADLETCLEYIDHPAVFSHDARKAALQVIGVISSRRAFTFRTATESIWAGRIPGIKTITDSARDWRVSGVDTLAEE